MASALERRVPEAGRVSIVNRARTNYSKDLRRSAERQSSRSTLQPSSSGLLGEAGAALCEWLSLRKARQAGCCQQFACCTNDCAIRGSDDLTPSTFFSYRCTRRPINSLSCHNVRFQRSNSTRPTRASPDFRSSVSPGVFFPCVFFFLFLSSFQGARPDGGSAMGCQTRAVTRGTTRHTDCPWQCAMHCLAPATKHTLWFENSGETWLERCEMKNCNEVGHSRRRARRWLSQTKLKFGSDTQLRAQDIAKEKPCAVERASWVV